MARRDPPLGLPTPADIPSIELLESIPIVEPINARPLGLEFRDLRDATQRDREGVAEIQLETLRRIYPPSTYCISHASERLDREAGRDIATSNLKRHDQAFFEVDADRQPLDLVVYQAGSIVGLFQWMGVRILAPPGNAPANGRLRFSASFYPSFADVDLAEFLERSFDVVEFFGERLFPLRGDRRRLDLVTARTPLFKRFGIPETPLVRGALAELERRGRQPQGITLNERVSDRESFMEVGFRRVAT